MALVKLGDKAEGSVVKLKENGVLVEFYVAMHNYESELNGIGRTLMVRKDGHNKRSWSISGSVTYGRSGIDTWFTKEYKPMLDDDIQAAIGTTKIRCATNISYSVSVGVLERSVFALSLNEVGGGPVYGCIAEGDVLPTAGILKIAYLNGSAVEQWTRSSGYDTRYEHQGQGGDFSGHAAYMSKNGTPQYGSKSYSTGATARPAFTLPETLWVTDDGTVTTNTAPSTPPSLTVPSQINGGSTITLSWGASSDAEGNLAGYKAERSLDGGTTWSQVYQGGGTSTTNIVPFGTETVMYRVKAYDSAGLESAWRTSAQVAVINNTAPTVPGSITVPEAVQGGRPLTISWGASSDGENNLAGYSLERQVDGGDWAAVYSGDQLSFTDSVTKGWLSVAYRVRAFDTASAYSGFAISETRQINNNTPPAITCEYPGNTPLGVKSEGFEISYSVSDEEGDQVSVSEAVDGAALRTFTAELGVENSFALGGLDWMRLLNGRHTLSITAADGASSTAHSLSFTKEVTKASVTLEQPMSADGPITVCVLAASGFIPADAQYTVMVTNNANDGAPVWEDCTAAVRSGGNHIFDNSTAVEGFAFNFKLSVERGPGGQGGYITSVQGGFQ